MRPAALDPLVFLVIVLPIIPIAAALINRGVAISLSIVTFLVWGAVFFFLRDAGVSAVLLVQLPLLACAAGVAIHFAGGPGARKASRELILERRALDELKAVHAEVKEAVLKAEKEENRSLQIYGVAKSLAEALSWKDMAPRLTAAIQKILGGYEFLLYATTAEGGWDLLHRRGSWTKEPPLGAPLAEMSDVTQFIHPPQVVEVVPVLMVPIYSTDGTGRKKNGILFLKSSNSGQSDPELVEAGREFGEQLGMALNKARLFSEVETHSRLDGLTGALRRQPFMDRLEDELKRASVFHTPFSVLMVDIDHFKGVNDSHGHAAGDAVLARVGQILKESFYETDVVGRYGGEEFIVLLPRAERDGVLRKAEGLRQRFERETIPSGFERLKITVSIGLAHHPDNGRTAEQLIAQADKALYEAKRTGRNKVVAA